MRYPEGCGGLSDVNSVPELGAGASRPIRPWPAGAPTLAEVVGVDPLGLRDNPAIPVRLYSGNLLHRPWPTHPLDEQIVDLAYVPRVEPTEPEQAWTLTIENAFTVSFHGLRKRLRQTPLLMFNLYLLLRDWSIRDDELEALHLMTVDDGAAYEQAATNTRSTLKQMVAPRPFFEKQHARKTEYPPTSSLRWPHRMSPNIILKDNR